MVTTVSRTYAEEIKTPFYGEHLDGLMRARSNVLHGIVNGLDYKEWDPGTDALIYKKYTRIISAGINGKTSWSFRKSWDLSRIKT